jgi:hypothetical protein
MDRPARHPIYLMGSPQKGQIEYGFGVFKALTGYILQRLKRSTSQYL